MAMANEPPARDAATIMLVRDSAAGSLEVCMVRRHIESDFVGGAYVFPGGKVDEEDRGEDATASCIGRSDVEASTLLGIDRGGLAFWVAALRECFEEAGVLFCYPQRAAPGSPLVDATDPGIRAHLVSMRAALAAAGRNADFLAACAAEGLCLAVDRVHYFSHWITPEGAPKRYDTRFFVAALPPGQVAVHDDHETVDTVWVDPADALARAATGELEIIFPTMKNLEAISRFATAQALLDAALAIEKVPTVLPRVVVDERGFRILLPGDEGYDEAITPPEQRATTAAEVSEAIRSIGLDGRAERR
jgi:8-oxo-dGTP pyrophosphatase MutT (NUDIX family)